jgi:glycosyltransferase involved in cell wall biosynthesis
MKILIIHFRSAPNKNMAITNINRYDSAGTDGVSLEMAKRQALLEDMGHEVAICSAYSWADYPIPDLEFDREEVDNIRKDLFGLRITDSSNEAKLQMKFDIAVNALKKKLYKVVHGSNPDLIFVHNILCLPLHPVATVGLVELLEETGIPCAAIHHDVLSEGAYKFSPTCDFARKILENYFPPKMPNIRHWTINTRNKAYLSDKNVDAEVIHDSMDFENILDEETRKEMRDQLRAKYGIKSNDIVLFVGARIVPNKQTELAGHLTAVLQNMNGELIGKTLYNGQIFTDKSRIMLVLAGRPERDFLEYQNNLFQLFDALKINWRYVGNDVTPYTSDDGMFNALYPDMHTIADFVLYPTGWEGFGNQLLEAFASNLPVVVFEYPVFKEDIAPKGVKVVSLGGTILKERDVRGCSQLPARVLKEAVYEMKRILTDAPMYKNITINNIEVGKSNFSFEQLRAHLKDAIEWARIMTNK